MEKTSNMPIWVYLAFSSINKRQGALWLIWSCLAFTLYCIPWPMFFAGHGWIAKIFLLDDWSWFAMMVPVTLWYWVSLKWLDKHAAWERAAQEKG